MALSIDIILDNGIEIKNSYIVVNTVSIKKESKYTMIKLLFYKDKDSKDANMKPINTKYYEINGLYVSGTNTKNKGDFTFDKYFSIDVLNKLNNNSIKQSYNYLKTLDEFINSTDI